MSDQNLVLIFCQQRLTTPKFGFSISKKFGNAVKRNRTRRQLKECAQKLASRVKDNYSIVIIPRSNVTTEFSLLYTSFETLLASADLLTEQQGL